MSDFIERQESKGISEINKFIDGLEEIGKKVSIPNGSDDTISRQAAIDDIRTLKPDGVLVDAKWIEMWLKQLPSVQPEPKWIPCSERMPERADNVIICYKAGDYTLVSTGRYLYKFKMWYVDVVGDLRDGVTAWMSLPEPYKGGEK